MCFKFGESSSSSFFDELQRCPQTDRHFTKKSFKLGIPKKVFKLKSQNRFLQSLYFFYTVVGLLYTISIIKRLTICLLNNFVLRGYLIFPVDSSYFYYLIVKVNSYSYNGFYLMNKIIGPTLGQYLVYFYGTVPE